MMDLTRLPQNVLFSLKELKKKFKGEHDFKEYVYNG